MICKHCKQKLSTVALICCGSLILPAGSVLARRNILIGELSIRYDHQERSYTDTGIVAELPAEEGGSVVAGEAGETPAGAAVIVLEDRRGDRRNYIVAPRLTWSSTGMTDSLQLTYAPGLNYDHLNETTDLDHDFGLEAEKDLTRNWSVFLGNRFFLGDDPLRQEELQTTVNTQQVEGEPAEEIAAADSTQQGGEGLTERYGRRRYWTNDLDVSTDYRYGLDRSLELTYAYGVLRNDSDTVGGYTDYDRHTGSLGIDHRFDQRWTTHAELRYTKGLFDEPDIFLVSPADDGERDVDQLAGTDSDDLTEYNFLLRGGYDVDSHLHWFSEYSYLRTDYDAAVREDYHVNNLAVGVEYDFSSRLHMTLSGGPSWGAFDNSPTENDYNAHGEITWDYLHGALTFSAEKGYDQSNFDGRRSGLTDYWQTDVTLAYRITQSLGATVSAAYRDNRRLQFPTPQTIIIVDDGSPESSRPPEDFSRTEYTEKDYDIGLALDYTFLRWYTISGGYRYYDHDSDQVEGGTGSYTEHRLFVVLSVSKELLRW